MYQANSTGSQRFKSSTLTIQDYLDIVKDKSNKLYSRLPRKEKKQVDALRSLHFLKIKAKG
jgi:hypothetical protein